MFFHLIKSVKTFNQGHIVPIGPLHGGCYFAFASRYVHVKVPRPKKTKKFLFFFIHMVFIHLVSKLFKAHDVLYSNVGRVPNRVPRTAVLIMVIQNSIK